MDREGEVSEVTPSRARVDLWLLAAVLVVVAGRLPLFGRPASPAEAGYLVIGGQWSPGGTPALRVIGILAAVAVVLLVAWTLRQLSGRVAARWGAVVAAALLVSPDLGAQVVNGELLAAPFVALGVGAAVASVAAVGGRRTLGWAAVAGAAGTAAVLVKQNMLDVFVFGAVLLVAHLLARSVTVRHAVRTVVGAVAGALATLGVAAVVTVARGTSLPDLFYAMYAFRVDASEVIARERVLSVGIRREELIDVWLVNGPALLTACILAGALWLRLREPALLAVLGVLAFDVWSVVMGSGYWNHYLVQMFVPLSIGTGLLGARFRPRLRVVPAAVVATVLVASLVAVLTPAPPERSLVAERVGLAVAGAAEPDDTLVVAYGGGQAQLASGLSTPYPHLWALPLRTLDPDLSDLEGLLQGPRAPTWFVVSDRLAAKVGRGGVVRTAVRAGYADVATIEGYRIFLRAGADRPNPVDPDLVHQ